MSTKIKYSVIEGKENHTIMCGEGLVDLNKKPTQTKLKKLYELGYTLYISKDGTNTNSATA
tara:strand:- start:1608 stop:1790 length:183 start_codon:yes stop_codon:yes gene_type:complete